MTAQTEVVPLAAPQVEAVGEVLRKAFYDNPGPKYVQPDDAKRAHELTWFMTRATRYGHIYGEVYTTAGKVEGAAIWLSPDDWEITANRSKKVGLDELPSIMGAEAFGRSSSMANHWEPLHKQMLRRGTGICGTWVSTRRVRARESAARSFGLSWFAQTPRAHRATSKRRSRETYPSTRGMASR